MRLFIAIEIPDNVIEKIQNTQNEFKALDSKNVKWVKPKAMHITLKFLGEVDPERVDFIISALEDLSFKKKHLYVEKLGVFPSFKKPRVFWAGVQDNNYGDFLSLLARDIDQAMGDIGFEKENRKFKSHLTIGRVKRKPEKKLIDYFFQKKDEIVFGDFVFDSIILYQSILKPRGAEYTVIKKILAKT